jgi:hypothetical protein
MKKLIMFLMLLAIAGPALATIEDLDPPQWGSTQPSATLVYQLDEDGDYEGGNVEPSCLEGSDDFYTDLPNATWADGVLSTEGDTFFALQIPAGGGGNITIRVQAIISSGPPWEYIVEQRNEGGGWLVEVNVGEPTVSPLADDLYVLEGTMAIKPEAFWATVSIIGSHHEIEGVILDVLVHNGDAPDIGDRASICFVQPVFVVDPNVVTVYEEGETEGDFDVSLYTQPETGDTITVTVDPNSTGGGPNEDLILFGGNPTDGSITLTFDANDYDVPQTIAFKAIDDNIAEPPSLSEPQPVTISSSSNLNPGDPNWVGELGIPINVVDNDQADILFNLVGAGPIRGTPVPLYEYQFCNIWFAPNCLQWIAYPQTIAVTMQVKPENDADPCSPGYVRVIVEQEGGEDNPPIMDPCLLPEHAHTPGDPNAIVFTSDGNPAPPGVIGAVRKWDVPFNIVLLGNDDDELQAYGEEEGGQLYDASLEFTVTHTTDARYRDDEGAGLERTVDISIEDNDCGAFGILPVDVGNPYYVMDEETLEATLGGDRDPNDWIDDEGNPMPDCYVNIYDILEFATQWLDCSDPQDLTPGGPCTSYIVE